MYEAEGIMPSLDIIIVNLDSGVQLQRCLDSMPLASREGFSLGRVVVVDNASSDGSAERLNFPELPLLVIHNRSNRGFAAACNQGARESKADYLLFLNPDTALERNSLTAPIDFLERPENAHIGISGVQLVDEGGRVSRSCARFPTAGQLMGQCLGLGRLFPRSFPDHFLSEWDHSESRVVDQIMGAFFLVRRGVFDLLGGFDERFFLYFEELDFSHRARQAGWTSYFLATTRAMHHGCGWSEQFKVARLFYVLRSRILYSYKHFGRVAATGVLLGTVLAEPLSRVALGAAHGSLIEIQDTLRAYVMLWRCLPKIVAKDREFRSRHPLEKEVVLE
jgi:N-acetylglucosaminyl-diphospho-decaprenol L-rhamnosyltransferase